LQSTAGSKVVKIDWDSILMLSLSVLWVFITLGFVLFWYGAKVYQVAKTAKPNVQNNIWILFGKQLKANQLDVEFKQRLNAIIDWLVTEKPKCILLQGGITGGNTFSEAQAGQAYLFNSPKFIREQSHLTALILEDNSINTLENLKHTREYLQQENLPLKVTLISNRYHLLRCSIMAENMGFSTVYLPAEKEWHLNLTQVYKVLLEAFFLNWYCTGKFVSQLLNNHRILNKIS
jgi:uncharacterized SAM-binding protein YcdF (DUF218 family)